MYFELLKEIKILVYLRDLVRHVCMQTAKKTKKQCGFRRSAANKFAIKRL